MDRKDDNIICVNEGPLEDFTVIHERARQRAYEKENNATKQKEEKRICCGIECIRNPQDGGCDCGDARQCLRDCSKEMAPFSYACCFYSVSLIVCFVIIMALSIYAITTIRPQIAECQDFTAFERHMCLKEINGPIVGFAFAICALIYSILHISWHFIWLFVDDARKPHATYQCSNGCPNRALSIRIGRIIFCLLLFLGVFLFAYCLPFYEDCRNDDEACQSYGKHLRDKITGFAFGLVLSIVGFGGSFASFGMS